MRLAPYPLSDLLASTGNFTAGAVTALAGLRDDSRMLQFSAPVQQGNSGGALLDERGAVVGVVTSKLDALNLAGLTSDIAQNVNFAIKSSLAINFLDTASVEPVYRDDVDALPPADIADRARKFSVKVTCDVGNASTPSTQSVRADPPTVAPGSNMRIEVGKSFTNIGYRPAGTDTLSGCAAVCGRESRCLAFQFSTRPIYDQRVHKEVQCRLYDNEAELDSVTSEGHTIGTKEKSADTNRVAVVSRSPDGDFSEHQARAMEGGDLKILKGESEAACKSLCGEDSRCRAYSYDLWNQYCFLKTELGFFRRDPRYLTALRGGTKVRDATTPHIIRKRSNKYFRSGSYSSDKARNFDACGDLCLADDRCDAISFDRASGTCHLLSGPTEYVDQPGWDIGLRLQEAP